MKNKGVNPIILGERCRIINELLSDTVIEMDLDDIYRFDQLFKDWIAKKECNISIEGLRDFFQDVRNYF